MEPFMAEQKSRLSKSWIIGLIQLVFVIGIIAAAVGFSSLLKSGNGSQSVNLAELETTGELNVRIVKPVGETYAPELKLNGTVQSQAEVTVTAQVSGEIKQVGPLFKPGSMVPKGTVLFSIDRSDYLLAVDRAEAEIAAAKSDLALLQAEADVAIEEWAELYPGREISPLAARIPQIEANKARLAGADANMASAKLNLSRTQVRAPFDARVLATSLDIGQVVAPNQTLGRLVSLGSIEVVVPVSSTQLQTLQPIVGRRADLSPRGATVAMPGQVVRVDATIDERTRLSKLYVVPDDTTGLTIGEFVDVRFQSDSENDALTIPASAMFAQGRVWVIDNGVLVSREVRVIGERGGDLVIENIDMGDGIVALPPTDAVEGQKVSSRDPKMGVAGSVANAAR
jgi:RND family efflux transporter MFP subunit